MCGHEGWIDDFNGVDLVGGVFGEHCRLYFVQVECVWKE